MRGVARGHNRPNGQVGGEADPRNRAGKIRVGPYGRSMAIIRVLLALLADRVMDSVATSRQTYLTEFSRYLDRRGVRG